MKAEKLVMVPFDKNGIPIVKLINSMKEYAIKRIVAPKTVLLSGADIGGVQNRLDFGFAIKNSFKDSLSDCDSVLILNHEDRLKRYVYNCMEDAIKINKRIILLFEPDEELVKLISAHNPNIVYHRELKHFEIHDNTIQTLKMETPVVFIGGEFSLNSTNEIAVDLTVAFRENGYKTSTVCTDKNLLFDDNFFTVPDILYNNTVGEVEKIEKIKDWMLKLEKAKKPDIIIITVPEAMMIVDDSFHAGYCVYPFLISSAIKPDYFILDASYGKNKDYYSKVSNHFLHRYGYSVDYVVKTNLFIDYRLSKDARRLHYSYISAKKITEEVKQDVHEEVKTKSILYNDYASFIVEDVILKLS